MLRRHPRSQANLVVTLSKTPTTTMIVMKNPDYLTRRNKS